MRRLEIGALVSFLFACAWLVQGPGFNQNAHYALVRAIARGKPYVDPYRDETGDVTRYRGHWYAAKAPGLALVSLPPYALLHGSSVVRRIRTSGGAPGAGRENI